VTELVTPGSMNDEVLQSKTNNFFGIHFLLIIGISLDVSTGVSCSRKC
jgi:hypothetical protein